MQKKLYYLVGSGISIATGILLGSVPSTLAAAATIFFVGPYAMNRPQLLLLKEEEEEEEEEDERGEGGSLRILTFNIFMRPSLWFVRNNADDYKNERLKIFIRDYLEHYDVVCLQEMFGTLSFRQRRLFSAAKERGFRYAAIGGAAPFIISDHHLSLKIPFLDSGVVVLSKYPILKTDVHHYSSSVLIDSWAPKVALWALVKVGEDCMHIFNTHMQSTHTGWSAEETIIARARQVDEMAFFVREKLLAHRNCPAIICGDFNLDARGRPLEYIRMVNIFKQALQKDVLAELGWSITNVLLTECSEEQFPATYALEGERILTLQKDWDRCMCLDYIFFVGPPDQRKDARLAPFFRLHEKNMPATMLSDHQGVECALFL